MSKNDPPLQDAAELVTKFRQVLTPSGWAGILKYWFASPNPMEVFKHLQLDRSENRRFAPDLRTLVTALTLCPVDQVRVVLLTKEKPFRSTSYVPVPFWREQDPVTKEWILRTPGLVEGEFLKTTTKNPGVRAKERADAGLLALDVSLTTPVVGATTHDGLWSTFFKQLLEGLSGKNPKLHYIYDAALQYSMVKSRVGKNYASSYAVYSPLSRHYEERINLYNPYVLVNNQLKAAGEQVIPWWS